MNAKKSKLNRLYCFETEEVAARKIEFVGIDLKDPLSFQSTLMEMLLAKNIKGINDDDDDGSSSWTTIVVSEALFLYLQSVFCFADRLKDVFDEEDAQKWFVNNGWTLVDWLPKDDATRHRVATMLRIQIPSPHEIPDPSMEKYVNEVLYEVKLAK
eukprot:scaffold3142_cov119-Cylindrotheca_fusiformis.AAC.2